MITLKKIRDAIRADCYSSKGGVFTLRWGFFYTHGKTVQDYENKVKAIIPQAVIVESGKVWKDFRGGTPVSRQSHFFVKFTVS